MSVKILDLTTAEILALCDNRFDVITNDMMRQPLLGWSGNVEPLTMESRGVLYLKMQAVNEIQGLLPIYKARLRVAIKKCQNKG